MRSDSRFFSFVGIVVAVGTTLISLFPITRALSKIDPEAFDVAVHFLSSSLLRIGIGLVLIGLAIWMSSSRRSLAWGILLLTPIAVFTIDQLLRTLGR